jgi:hypothetical protein
MEGDDFEIVDFDKNRESRPIADVPQISSGATEAEVIIINGEPHTVNKIEKSKVFRLDYKGKTVSWIRDYVRDQNEVNIINKITNNYDCNTCNKRTRKFILMEGPSGGLIFQEKHTPNQSIREYKKYINNIHTMSQKMRNNLHRQCEQKPYSQKNYKLVLVDRYTFPPSKYTGPGSRSNETFYHITAYPDSFTDEELNLNPFIDQINNHISERLAAFLTPGARASVKIISDIIDNPDTACSRKLKRANYWVDYKYTRQIS